MSVDGFWLREQAGECGVEIEMRAFVAVRDDGSCPIKERADVACSGLEDGLAVG